jgi:hypothetical protein
MRETSMSSSQTPKPTPPGKIVSARRKTSADAGRPTRGQAVAAVSAVVALLGLAGVGVVFTVKYRSPHRPPPAHAPSEIVEVSPVTLASASVPSPRTSALPRVAEVPPAPTAEIESSEVPESEPLPPPPPAVKTEGPEELAVAPRPTVPEREVAVIDPKPAPVPMAKPRPEPTTEPSRPAPPPMLVVGEKPRLAVPAKQFPDTPAPPAARRPEQIGTRIDFLPTPAAAYERAKEKKEKLVMLLHYAGDFKNDEFACDSAESLRRDALADDDVAAFVNEHFLSAHQKISALKPINGFTSGGVVTYFCLSDGTVLHAIAGAVDAKAFLREAGWIVDARAEAIRLMKGDTTRYNGLIRKAHRDRYLEEYAEEPDPFGGMGFPLVPGPRGRGGFPGFLPPGLPRGLGGVPGMAQARGKTLPDQRPATQPPQAQIHWLLAKRTTSKVQDISKTVYQDILGEKLFAP